MGSSVNKDGVVPPLALSGVLLGIAYLVIPMIFGQRIEVSPFLLFGIVVICNVAQDFVPEPATRTPHTALRLFCMRLAASLLASVLLVVLYRVARALG